MFLTKNTLLKVFSMHVFDSICAAAELWGKYCNEYRGNQEDEQASSRTDKSWPEEAA